MSTRTPEAGEVEREHVLCAAIYVDTGSAEPARRSFTYPATGLVFAAWRHGDCFTTLNAWADRLDDAERARIGEEQLRGRHQGFLTSTGRFVDREEGARIAVAAGQVPAGMTFLTSEDVYPGCARTSDSSRVPIVRESYGHKWDNNRQCALCRLIESESRGAAECPVRLRAALDAQRGEVAKWRASFDGHVYVTMDDYGALCAAADPVGGAGYVLALKSDRSVAIAQAATLRAQLAEAEERAEGLGRAATAATAYFSPDKHDGPCPDIPDAPVCGACCEQDEALGDVVRSALAALSRPETRHDHEAERGRAP